MNGGSNKWTSPSDIESDLEKKWRKGLFLKEAIEPENLFPMRIPLRGPSASDLSNMFDTARGWVRLYSDSARDYLFRIEWTSFNHRVLGQNMMPSAVIFDSLQDVVKFLGKSKEYSLFTRLSHELLSTLP